MEGVNEEAEAPAGESLPHGSGRVLLVDDEELIRRFASTLLTRLGYTVDVATGGAEAIDLYEREGASIDVVILDISMPGMSGLEVCAKILEMNPKAHIILSSGYAEGLANGASAKTGAAAVLSKPYKVPELARIVRDAISRPEFWAEVLCSVQPRREPSAQHLAFERPCEKLAECILFCSLSWASPISPYGLLIAVGLLTGVFLARWRARQMGIPEDAVLDIVFWGVILGFVGARIAYLIVQFDDFVRAPMAHIFSRQGFVFLGGLLAGIPVAIFHHSPLARARRGDGGHSHALTRAGPCLWARRVFLRRVLLRRHLECALGSRVPARDATAGR